MAIGLDNGHLIMSIPFHPLNLGVNCADCHFGSFWGVGMNPLIWIYIITGHQNKKNIAGNPLTR